MSSDHENGQDGFITHQPSWQSNKFKDYKMKWDKLYKIVNSAEGLLTFSLEENTTEENEVDDNKHVEEQVEEHVDYNTHVEEQVDENKHVEEQVEEHVNYNTHIEEQVDNKHVEEQVDDNKHVEEQVDEKVIDNNPEDNGHDGEKEKAEYLHLRHKLDMKSQLMTHNEHNGILERTRPSKRFRVMSETPNATVTTAEQKARETPQRPVQQDVDEEGPSVSNDNDNGNDLTIQSLWEKISNMADVNKRQMKSHTEQNVVELKEVSEFTVNWYEENWTEEGDKFISIDLAFTKITLLLYKITFYITCVIQAQRHSKNICATRYFPVLKQLARSIYEYNKITTGTCFDKQLIEDSSDSENDDGFNKNATHEQDKTSNKSY
ncbi:unnamed protein product [Mytilus coruscus]|uniref:Uncharacterized protein n=1 Tax=Mytilus coruscus TaxID=42192 RepID=A0A6J8DRS9_MYTCO|nr:unnamed protein product [Mytilus coruscus]